MPSPWAVGDGVPVAGLHLVEVTYDDVAVPKSPFRVGVAEGCDPTRVRAHGPGLEGGLVGTANHFTVETRWALTPNPNPTLLLKAPQPLPSKSPALTYSHPPTPHAVHVGALGWAWPSASVWRPGGNQS